jgi:hypothetical protein
LIFAVFLTAEYVVTLCEDGLVKVQIPGTLCVHLIQPLKWKMKVSVIPKTLGKIVERITVKSLQARASKRILLEMNYIAVLVTISECDQDFPSISLTKRMRVAVLLHTKYQSYI